MYCLLYIAFQICVLEQFASPILNANSYYKMFNPIIIVLESCPTLTNVRICYRLSFLRSKYNGKVLKRLFGVNTRL